jgi:hypothetical protein
MSTKRGVPGGCGMPSVFEAAINSPASQSVTVGARVKTYPAKIAAKTSAAIR